MLLLGLHATPTVPAAHRRSFVTCLVLLQRTYTDEVSPSDSLDALASEDANSESQDALEGPRHTRA